MKTKRGLKSPLEAKIQKTDPIGFFYEQKCPFDENLVYLAQKLSKPLFFMSSDFEIGVPFLIWPDTWWAILALNLLNLVDIYSMLNEIL